MPLRLPYGPGPLDPRQPRQQVIIPDQKFQSQRYMQPSASPVHLSSSLVLRANTSGSVPPAALKNPMGQDMELLEIKFELSGAATDQTYGAWGGTIRCELMLGSLKITNGSIPVWSFGRAENLDGETKFDTTDLLTFQAFSWRLPRPLFIPKGAVVVPVFTHTGMVPTTINVRVGYSCRTVFTKPKKIYLPWVAKYTSKAFNPITAADTDISSELDLVNPNSEVFHLQRFTGRALVMLTGSIPSENSVPAFASRHLSMRMTDSYGRPIVRTFTPFRSVFGALTRSWEMDNGAELDPEAYYRVELKKALMTDALAGVISGQVFIGMVGWRELEGGM